MISLVAPRVITLIAPIAIALAGPIVIALVGPIAIMLVEAGYRDTGGSDYHGIVRLVAGVQHDFDPANLVVKHSDLQFLAANLVVRRTRSPKKSTGSQETSGFRDTGSDQN